MFAVAVHFWWAANTAVPQKQNTEKTWGLAYAHWRQEDLRQNLTLLRNFSILKAVIFNILLSDLMSSIQERTALSSTEK